MDGVIDVTGKMPGWAIDLTLKVARQAGRSDLPSIKWRTRHRQPGVSATHSSGRAFEDGRVTISAGRSSKDQRLVLLHELAHWLAPTRDWHSDAFWDRAFALYAIYFSDMAYAWKRERDYRKGAAGGYARIAAITQPQP